MHKLFLPTQVMMSGCGALALLAIAGTAGAATVPTVVSRPVGAATQGVGSVIFAVGLGHAGVAPTVVSAAPSLEPFADGVTTSLTSLGGGVYEGGRLIQSNGLKIYPAAGAHTALSTLKNGSLVQVRAGTVQLGKGSPTTIVGVGALSSGAPHGTLATAGVANANGLLTGSLAPQ